MRAFGIIGNCRGKSSLVPGLVAELGTAGIDVSTLKRVGDEVDLDRPGKESHAHRLAGAREVMIANGFRWALMREHAGLEEPEVDDLLARLDPVDLVLIEGFHLSPYPKCEIVTAGQDRRPSYLQDSSIVALVTDVTVNSSLPQFPLSATAELAAFILSVAGEVASAQRGGHSSATAATTIAHRQFAR